MARTTGKQLYVGLLLGLFSLSCSGQTYNATTIAGADGQVVLVRPQSVSVDSSGNVYFVDTGAQQAYRLTAAGTLSNITPASPALSAPSGITADNAGTIYVSESGGFRITQITPTGVASTYAGTGTPGYSGDGGPARSAQLGANLQQLAIDRRANLYIVDSANFRIRRVALDGTITTFAGNGGPGTSGDGGLAVNAGMSPAGVAVDTTGNVFIAENNAIRKVDANTGIISTVAGGPNPGYGGDNGPAANSLLRGVTGVAVDGSGNLYIADRGNRVVRRVSSAGVITTIAGTPSSSAFNGDTGSATTLGMDPVQVAVDPLGAVYVADAANHRIRKLTSSGATTISEGGVIGAGLSPTPVRNLSPGTIATIFGQNFAAAGTSRVLTSGDIVANRLPTSLGDVCVQIGSARAYIYAVFPGQINFQVPALPEGNYVLQVLTNCGSPSQGVSNSVSVTIQAASPEFFYFSQSGGKGYIAAVNGTTGAYVGPPGLVSGTTFAPARPGDVLVLYGTGFGPAGNPLIGPGVISTEINRLASGLRLTIGGRDVPFENIEYAGLTPTYAGLYQINVRLPADLPDGDQPVTISIGGAAGATSPVGYITIRR